MFFQLVYDKTLAQASYLIGCQAKGVAMVIDAKRDIDTYLAVAQQNHLKITHIAETHIHADFLSGSRELAAVTGASIYLSDEGGPDWQYQFPHIGLTHGSKIEVGNLTFEVLHTPGHTPESISFLLTDNPASTAPVMLFTGDFVFVGDIGRPDLLEKAAGLIGTQEQGARQMFKSIRQFTTLPAHIQLWPGHGAGSACGKALGAVPSSTVGYEKIRNWAFQFENDQEGFVHNLLEGQPEPPTYFAMMKKLNKEDRPLLIEVPKHAKLDNEAFLHAYHNGIKVIDTRSFTDFAKGFIPGSINIHGNNAFATWMGWIMNYQEQFILVTSDAQINELTRKLMRIGMDNILGYITDVNEPGIPLQQGNQATLEELTSYAASNELQILDVRNKSEFDTAHINGASHVFVGTLLQHLDKVAKDKQVITLCQNGTRAALAYSLLRKNGYENVKNFPGGMKEWTAAGLPVE
ncbi:hydroxyacylglutathione hydrolase [Filimonas lacunae]|uniref:Hydroxyacylglutathione hydrolase n=1 Tax=Filimonas lacunae TaxID=477680 RepID=A0A173MI24_9BACT|nr:MBL fold metallo-hydrolase [Filimonas lacunae]BAV07071.1 metallo-beta-lactamase family protein [Filimonas lacunae]SIS95400.1 hydroxyacylglutathione hydrolase [Filimonas lacunae]